MCRAKSFETVVFKENRRVPSDRASVLLEKVQDALIHEDMSLQCRHFVKAIGRTLAEELNPLMVGHLDEMFKLRKTVHCRADANQVLSRFACLFVPGGQISEVRDDRNFKKIRSKYCQMKHETASLRRGIRTVEKFEPHPVVDPSVETLPLEEVRSRLLKVEEKRNRKRVTAPSNVRALVGNSIKGARTRMRGLLVEMKKLPCTTMTHTAMKESNTQQQKKKKRIFENAARKSLEQNNPERKSGRSVNVDEPKQSDLPMELTLSDYMHCAKSYNSKIIKIKNNADYNGLPIELYSLNRYMNRKEARIKRKSRNVSKHGKKKFVLGARKSAIASSHGSISETDDVKRNGRTAPSPPEGSRRKETDRMQNRMLDRLIQKRLKEMQLEKPKPQKEEPAPKDPFEKCSPYNRDHQPAENWHSWIATDNPSELVHCGDPVYIGVAENLVDTIRLTQEDNEFGTLRARGPPLVFKMPSLMWSSLKAGLSVTGVIRKLSAFFPQRSMTQAVWGIPDDILRFLLDGITNGKSEIAYCSRMARVYLNPDEDIRAPTAQQSELRAQPFISHVETYKYILSGPAEDGYYFCPTLLLIKSGFQNSIDFVNHVFSLVCRMGHIQTCVPQMCSETVARDCVCYCDTVSKSLEMFREKSKRCSIINLPQDISMDGTEQLVLSWIAHGKMRSVLPNFRGVSTVGPGISQAM